jgi:hypothetical protein
MLAQRPLDDSREGTKQGSLNSALFSYCFSS